MPQNPPNDSSPFVNVSPALGFQHHGSKPSAFPPSIFSAVMLNLIENPNITSSHLFRADIMYDSENDPTYAPLHNPVQWDDGTVELCGLFKHMKACYRPRPLRLQGWTMTRTIVREMIPRNPKLDRTLAQTCCFYEREGEEDIALAQSAEGLLNSNTRMSPDDMRREVLSAQTYPEAPNQTLVVYIPHVEKEYEVPYYHPKVSAVAFLYGWQPHTDERRKSPYGPEKAAQKYSAVGVLSIYSAPFAQSSPNNDQATSSPRNEPQHDSKLNRLNRTLNNLLQTIHRHGTGRLQGYTKRVHHDIIIPQKHFQTTYTNLKLKYASRIAQDWHEATDPTKHVFEDLGIASWLMELWRDMYGIDPEASKEEKTKQGKTGGFDEFVDIGCGNGLLIALLRWEGYEGWGFDVRRRKSWGAFEASEDVKGRLKEMALMPAVLEQDTQASPAEPDEEDGIAEQCATHSGVFSKTTFIISNHADELTAWTPLLAHLSSGAPFLAIPCCSHDLSGARTRFPPQKLRNGSGERTSSNPSAYHTLCDYTEKLADDVGYKVTREYLRIPSTRNVGLLGVPDQATRLDIEGSEVGAVVADQEHAGRDTAARFDRVRNVVKTQLKGQRIEDVGLAWRQRIDKLRNVKGECGH